MAGDGGRSMGETCGWGCISCRCLQRFKHLPWLAAALCFFSFLNGMNYGNFNVVLTSLERRFGFCSKESGLLATSAHIGGLSAILFVSHFGATSHKPRILALGALTCSLASALRALPHFLEGPYDYSGLTGGRDDAAGKDYPICQLKQNVTDSTCQATDAEREKASQTAMIVLIIGQLLAGAGFSPMASLAPLIFEENMGGAHTPMFLAINNAIGALGIATGYLLGALSLRLFVDIGRNVHIDNKDPRWVGAWWLLFVITSSLLFIDALLLFAFPFRITSKENSYADLATAGKRESSTKSKVVVLDFLEAESFKPEEPKPQWAVFRKLVAMPKSVWKLLKIPAFTLLMFTGVVEVLIFSSISSFGTKLFEENFQLTSTHAGLAMGSVAIIGGAGGTLGGGLLMRKLRLSPRTIAKLCSISAIVASVASISYVFHCTPRPLTGFQVAYKDSNQSFAHIVKMRSQCNAPCNCDRQTFSPVCGADGVTYFSPCHAGCSGRGIKNNSTFTECRCIERASPTSPKQHHRTVHHYAADISDRYGLNLDPPSADYGGDVTKGKCGPPGPCNNFYVALIFLLLGVVCRSIMITPISVLILRCVPTEEKAFSLGLEWLGSKLFGTIPGPVLLGTIIDSACGVWQTSCKGRGQCWVYNLGDLNLRLALYWSGTCVLSSVFSFCAARYLGHDAMDSRLKSFSFTIPPPLNYVPSESSDSEDSYGMYDITRSVPEVVKTKSESTVSAQQKYGVQKNASGPLSVSSIYDNVSM